MFGISFEHIIIVGIILLIVGPRKLPELGNTMGKALKNFKDSISGVEEAAFKRINDKPGDKPNDKSSEKPDANKTAENQTAKKSTSDPSV